MSPFNNAAVIGLGIGTVTLTWLTLRYVGIIKKKKLPSPLNWKCIGTLKEINLYPIKSTAGIVLDECECDKFGIHFMNIRDRQLVLMHKNGKLSFAGAYPHMLSIKAEFLSERLIRFTAPNVEPLTVDIISFNKQKTVVKIPKKGFTLQLLEGEALHHKWFSEILLKKASGVRLFLSLQPVIHNAWYHLTTPEYFPVMLVNKKSVDDLNARLPCVDQVQSQQFRGNLLIDTVQDTQPYDEDNWKWVKIGDCPERSVILHFNSYCYRCILPNIDLNTFDRNTNYEPLRTLKTYRILDNPKEPVMGTYFDVYKAGIINKNDQVYVQY